MRARGSRHARAGDDRAERQRDSGDAGKERRSALEEDGSTAVVEAASRHQIVQPPRGIQPHVVDRANQALLGADQVVGPEKRQQCHRDSDAGDRQAPSRVAGSETPRLGPHDERRDERRGHHAPSCSSSTAPAARTCRQQQQQARGAPRLQHAIEGVEHDREELDVQRLQMREARQQVRVEGVQAARDDARRQCCRSSARISSAIAKPDSAKPPRRAGCRRAPATRRPTAAARR